MLSEQTLTLSGPWNNALFLVGGLICWQAEELKSRPRSALIVHLSVAASGSLEQMSERVGANYKIA